MNAGMITTPGDLLVFLRETGTKVLSNIIFNGSPGHQIYELDYFLRMHRAGRVARDGKYLWIQRTTPITQAMVETYGAAFRQSNLGMIAHDAVFQMMSEVTRLIPELGIDVGLSHIKNAIASREGTFPIRFADGIYYAVTNAAVVGAHFDYYKLRGLTADFNPWAAARPAIDGPLADLVGGDLDRLAVVHFRYASGNAGLAIPPEHMLPALAFLRDSGFTIVKLGTEPYPAEFARLGVVNYSESPLRSFRNDLALLCNAKIALINASGLENIGDIMEIPTVSYARWHMTLVPYSSRTVVLPALLFDPVRQRLMTFGEQMLFFKTLCEYWEGEPFSWHIPRDRFSLRSPQADELLAAVQEAEGLRTPRELSPRQLRFNQLDANGPLSVVKSRVSDFFLERFQELL